LLREVSRWLGLQLQARDFCFETTHAESDHASGISLKLSSSAASPSAQNSEAGNGKKKKKKTPREGSPATPPSSVLTTFCADDIVNILPVVKHSCPRSALAEEAYEAGQISILQGDTRVGQELLLESLSLHEQIYGILHPEVAKAYNALSHLYFQMDEKEIAVELARKAIVVSERTIGIDSADTLLNYLNLSLYLHQADDSNAALVYAKHAMELWRIVYGRDHPDSITTTNNVAVMLQHLRAYHESRRWFEESLRICEDVFGKQSIHSATLLFQLAQALALDQESKGSVQRMRESYNIFLNELGPADKNTKEAESWLEKLTQNAVSIAKQAKEGPLRRVQGGMRFQPAKTPFSSGGNMVRTATNSYKPTSQADGKLDSRSIDELIKFIEGTDSVSKSGKRRAGRSSAKGA
jgi:protein TIF31